MRLSTIPDSKFLIKGVQIGPKFKRELGTQESQSTLPNANRHILSVDWHKFVAWPEDSWIEINLTFSYFFRDKDASQFVSDLIEASQPL